MAHEQQIAKPDHGGEQVVKIMRDTARQLANGLHFLGVSEAQLQIFLLGLVDHVQKQHR